MLEAICKLLQGLCEARSSLSPMALAGLIDLIRTTYGDYVADTVRDFFEEDEDDGSYRCYDEVEDALRICLQGRG
jgi:hypothetical protein